MFRWYDHWFRFLIWIQRALYALIPKWFPCMMNIQQYYGWPNRFGWHKLTAYDRSLPVILFSKTFSKRFQKRFQKRTIFFWDTMIVMLLFFILKIHTFRGDSTNTSAKTRTLLLTSLSLLFHSADVEATYARRVHIQSISNRNPLYVVSINRYTNDSRVSLKLSMFMGMLLCCERCLHATFCLLWSVFDPSRFIG